MQQTSVKRADRAALEERYTQQRNEARFTMLLAIVSVCGAAVLLRQAAIAALRRCCRPPQHRTAGSRQPPSHRILRTTGHRVAAAAAHRHAAVRLGERALAERHCRRYSRHAGVCSWNARNLSAGECARGTGRSLPCGCHLCAESQPALHADHGDERADLPGVLRLVAGVSRRVPARHVSATGGFASTAGATQPAALAGVLRHHDVWRAR